MQSDSVWLGGIILSYGSHSYIDKNLMKPVALASDSGQSAPLGQTPSRSLPTIGAAAPRKRNHCYLLAEQRDFSFWIRKMSTRLGLIFWAIYMDVKGLGETWFGWGVFVMKMGCRSGRMSSCEFNICQFVAGCKRLRWCRARVFASCFAKFVSTSCWCHVHHMCFKINQII